MRNLALYLDERKLALLVLLLVYVGTVQYLSVPIFTSHCLKGHGNETDFMIFLCKSVRQRSLTQMFKSLQFCLEFAEIFII
jgi:hypothetical protein